MHTYHIPGPWFISKKIGIRQHLQYNHHSLVAFYLMTSISTSTSLWTLCKGEFLKPANLNCDFMKAEDLMPCYVNHLNLEYLNLELSLLGWCPGYDTHIVTLHCVPPVSHQVHGPSIPSDTTSRARWPAARREARCVARTAWGPQTPTPWEPVAAQSPR